MDDVYNRKQMCGISGIFSKWELFQNCAVWIVTVISILSIHGTVEAICPSRCQCNDDALKVSCINTGLEFVPIQLNPELIHLNLSQNRINNVHYTLSFYNNLEILDLAYNRIQTLGSSNFESQHKLIKLNVSNNYVTTLSKDTFKGLKQVEMLDLSYNQISNILVSALSDLKNLKVLYLNNNNLVSFEPDSFKHLTNLEMLVLRSNQILEIPSDLLRATPNLNHLDLSHNLIEQISHAAVSGLVNLEYLNLDSNVISEMSPTAFIDLPALQCLDLSDNNLTAVPTQQMSKLSNLTQLKLNGNFVEQIEALAFRSLFQLRYLFLSRLDRLVSIDARAFVDNVNLEKVWIDSDTQLIEIPTRIFHGSTQISHISIRNSAIRNLEPAHFPLDQLISLKLSGDNFICNCSLLWLWKLIREESSENDQFRLEANGVVCAFPTELAGKHLSVVRESDISCSNDWTITITCILFVCFLIVIIASLVTYFTKCLPKRITRTNVPSSTAPVPTSSSHADNLSRQFNPQPLYDHHSHHSHLHHHHYHQPQPQLHHQASEKDFSMLTPWDIAYHDEYQNYPKSSKSSMHGKQKPPHIVFV